MATTRSKKSGDSKSVEKKQVEAPKAKEVKEAPKPVEKKAEAPKPLRKDNLSIGDVISSQKVTGAIQKIDLFCLLLFE